jgi:type 1 glutamine amidotransferase
MQILQALDGTPPGRGGRALIRAILPALGVAVSAAAVPETPAPVARAEVEAALAKAGPASAPAGPLRIVLLADRKDHGPGAHDYPLWQENWTGLLRRAAGVTVETASGWPSDAQFESADAIAAFCYLAWTDARKAQVRRFQERGGGLVLIHSATWTKPKPDPAVAELTGVGGFTRYRHGEVRVEIVEGDHPICAGLPRVVALRDETYWPPTPAPDPNRVTALAVSREADGPGGPPVPQPVFWACGAGRGRVFGCVPGHFTSTFDDPWFRLLLLRGIAWAGGSDPRRLDPLALEGARVR